jgi:Ca2+/Na+ antiporter
VYYRPLSLVFRAMMTSYQNNKMVSLTMHKLFLEGLSFVLFLYYNVVYVVHLVKHNEKENNPKFTYPLPVCYSSWRQLACKPLLLSYQYSFTYSKFGNYNVRVFFSEP